MLRQYWSVLYSVIHTNKGSIDGEFNDEMHAKQVLLLLLGMQYLIDEH